jgi:integrase
MSTLLKVFFETGARTIEILNLQMQNCELNKSTGKWLVKLPNMKGISTDKMPIELEYANDDFTAWINANNFQLEDYIFNYSYGYLRVRLRRLGLKYLKKDVSPRFFRKSCAMHLVNLDINEQYIKGHMGWSVNSKAISHYINQKAIKRLDRLSIGMRNNSQQEELDQLKEQIKRMETLLMQKVVI